MRKPARTKGAKERRQPTGDYTAGYCLPSAEHRFKPGNRGGPGRPKGSRSQDSFLREELDKKRKIRIEGREVTISHRQLAAKILIVQALEKKDPKLLAQVLAHGQRLFPETPTDTGTANDASAPEEISETDRTILAWFADEIRAENGGDDE